MGLWPTWKVSWLQHEETSTLCFISFAGSYTTKRLRAVALWQLIHFLAERALLYHGPYCPSKTGVLHTGQHTDRPCCRSHSSMHPVWKWCRHGSVLTSCLGTKSSRQMLHVSNSSSSVPSAAPCQSQKLLAMSSLGSPLSITPQKPFSTMSADIHFWFWSSIINGAARQITHLSMSAVDVCGQCRHISLSHGCPPPQTPIIQRREHLIIRLQHTRLSLGPSNFFMRAFWDKRWNHSDHCFEDHALQARGSPPQ